jgi:uncharacterized protein
MKLVGRHDSPFVQRGGMWGLPIGNVARGEIDRPDMVQVFRRSDEFVDVARKAVKIGAKVLWGQIGVYNEEAARVAEDAGLKVVSLTGLRW